MAIRQERFQCIPRSPAWERNRTTVTNRTGNDIFRIPCAFPIFRGQISNENWRSTNGLFSAKKSYATLYVWHVFVVVFLFAFLVYIDLLTPLSSSVIITPLFSPTDTPGFLSLNICTFYGFFNPSCDILSLPNPLRCVAADQGYDQGKRQDWRHFELIPARCVWRSRFVIKADTWSSCRHSA
jgi:hypothetical protein